LTKCTMLLSICDSNGQIEIKISSFVWYARRRARASMEAEQYV
jgi:hypothetical protein